jgi:hypothetical protein
MAQYVLADSAPIAQAPSGSFLHRRVTVTATAGTLGSFISLADPSVTSVTPNGTAGAVTYGYKVVAFLGDFPTAASAEVTTNTGNATLSAINFNRVVWGAVTNATHYHLYRTTGGTTPPMLIYSGPLLTYDDVLKSSGTAEVPSDVNLTGGLPYLVSPIAPGVKLYPKAVNLGIEVGSTANTVYITFDGQSTPSTTLGFILPTLPSYLRIPCPDGLTLDNIKLVASANPTYVQLFAEVGA